MESTLLSIDEAINRVAGHQKESPERSEIFIADILTDRELLDIHRAIHDDSETIVIRGNEYSRLTLCENGVRYFDVINDIRVEEQDTAERDESAEPCTDAMLAMEGHEISWIKTDALGNYLHEKQHWSKVVDGEIVQRGYALQGKLVHQEQLTADDSGKRLRDAQHEAEQNKKRNLKSLEIPTEVLNLSEEADQAQKQENDAHGLLWEAAVTPSSSNQKRTLAE